MTSKTEYYRNLLNAHDKAIRELYADQIKITGKKRKYSEAMGIDNDYEVVQEPHNYISNSGYNWTDAYLENRKKS